MKRKLQENQQLQAKKIIKNHHDDWCCLLDFNYSSNLLTTKIADIPHELKYKTILAPIFEYCFGTSDQDVVWEELTNEEKECYESGDDFYKSDNEILTLQIDWIRDERFIYSKVLFLVKEKLDILARKFGLWNNRKFVLNSCYSISNSLRYANEEFRNDREFVIKILREWPQNIEYISDELRNDKEIVKQAVKRHGRAFQYASKELQDDKEILLIALESWIHAYKYASKRLQNDRDVVFKAVSNGMPLPEDNDIFNNDRELLLVSSKGECGSYVLRYACSELKTDTEFVKELVMLNGECLEFAPNEFQNDREIVELALKTSPDAIHYISSCLRKETENILRLIGKRGFRHLPNEFSNDREIVLESIKTYGPNLRKASKDLQNDREFILQVVKNQGFALSYANDKFKSDREIVMEAVTQDGDAIHCVADQFFDDEEIIIKAGQTFTFFSIGKIKKKLSNRLKSNREFIMQCGSFFGCLPRKYLLDREIVLEVLKSNHNSLIQCIYPLLVTDRVLAMKIVKRNGFCLGHMLSNFRNDREIVSFAIQQNKEAFKYASDELQNDLEILKLYNC